MKPGSFLKTKSGGLTIAFIVIMIAFFVIRAGLGAQQDAICAAGFLMIIAAMLYAPLKEFVIDRKKK